DLTLSGPISFRLWAATDSNGATADVRVSVANCRILLGFIIDCNAPLADATLSTSTWVQSGFQELVYDLGTPTESFGSGRELVVRVITEGSETIHTAFDSTVYPSQITLNLS
ncbi:MAG: hypothetical protein AAFO29_09630, partial [Actinomycetota bacterium]